MNNNTLSSRSGQGSSPWPAENTPSMPSDYTPRMTPPGAPARRLQRTSSSGSVTGPFRGGDAARRRLFSPTPTPPRTPTLLTPTPSLRRTMSSTSSPSPSVTNAALKDRVRDLKRRIEALEAEKDELKRAMRRGGAY